MFCEKEESRQSQIKRIIDNKGSDLFEVIECDYDYVTSIKEKLTIAGEQLTKQFLETMDNFNNQLASMNLEGVVASIDSNGLLLNEGNK